MVNPAAVHVTSRQIAAVLIEGALENNPNVPAAAELPDHRSLAWSTTPRLDLMNAVVEIAKERLAGVTPAERPAGEALVFLTRAPAIVNKLHARGDDGLRAPLSALADLQITMLWPFSAVNKWSEEHLVVIEAGFRMLNELLELDTNWSTTTFCEQLNTLAGAFLKSPALKSLLNSQQELNGAEAVHELVRAMDGLCDDELLENLARVAGLINRKCLFHLRQDEDVYDDEELTGDEDDYDYGDSSEPASSSFDKEDEEAIDAALDCWDETTRRILCKLTNSGEVSTPVVGEVEKFFVDSLECTELRSDALDLIAVHAPEKIKDLVGQLLRKMGTAYNQLAPKGVLVTLLRIAIIQQRYPDKQQIVDPTDTIVDEICEYYRREESPREDRVDSFRALMKTGISIMGTPRHNSSLPDPQHEADLRAKCKAILQEAKKRLDLFPKKKNPRGS